MMRLMGHPVVAVAVVVVGPFLPLLRRLHAVSKLAGEREGSSLGQEERQRARKE
jgi:hypothetical protein